MCCDYCLSLLINLSVFVFFMPICVSYVHLLTHHQVIRHLSREHLLINV